MNLKVGDRIRFKAATRWGCGPVTRVVNGFFGDKPTVRYGGWGDFIVQPWEIIAKV